MKKLQKKIWWLFSALNNKIECFSGLLHIVIIIMVAFVCSQAAAFSIVYIQLLNNTKISMVFFEYINIWKILPLENVTSKLVYSNFNSVKIKIEFLMNISIALSGILLSLVTFISDCKKNVDLKRKSCFRKKEIINTGIDDIKLMCEYFKGANFVAVYSHSFGWLRNSEEIRKILTGLANKNKLRLYSGDDVKEVKERLETYCNKNLLECIQKSKVSLRFSYVERNNAKYILYRQEEEERIYVICVRENTESQYLLQVISQLIKSF